MTDLARAAGRTWPVREARAVRQIASAEKAALSDAARRGLVSQELVERFSAQLDTVRDADALLRASGVTPVDPPPAPPADDDTAPEGAG
jgi:hypothetical protein